jgi:hypothetical protein
VQKSLSTKCLLHKKYLQTILAESILHAWPTFSAQAFALERKKKKKDWGTLVPELTLNNVKY